MNKFKVGDRVRVICKCNYTDCIPYHNLNGIIVEKNILCDFDYIIRFYGKTILGYYKRQQLEQPIKNIVKNELKGLLDK